MKFCVCSVVTNTWNFPELFNRVMILIFLSIFRSDEWILIKKNYALIYMIHVVTNTHFLKPSNRLMTLIDFRIMFMLNILWNNWWIWSDLVITMIFFMSEHAQQQK